MALATKVNVIVTPNKVYATYSTTILFERYFDKNAINPEAYRDHEIKNARACAFAQAVGHVLCLINEVYINEDWTPSDVFNYLEKTKN